MNSENGVKVKFHSQDRWLRGGGGTVKCNYRILLKDYRDKHLD